MLNEKWLAKSLLKAIVEPALKQSDIFDGDLSKHKIVLRVEGVSVDRSRPASDFTPGPQGAVALMLQLDAELTPTVFDIDIKSRWGDTLSETRAQLSAKQLTKPLSEMLIAPALEATGVMGVTHLKDLAVVFCDGFEGIEDEIDFKRLSKAAGSSFVRPNQGRTPIHVKITLPEGAMVEASVPSFSVSLVHAGETISVLDAKLNAQQLGRTVFDSLVRPALEGYEKSAHLDAYCTANLHWLISNANTEAGRRLTVTINGAAVPIQASVRSLVQLDGLERDVVITMPEPPPPTAPTGLRALAGQHPPTPSSVSFLVSIFSPPAGDSLAPAERIANLQTTLNRTWLKKQLREALIAPALNSLKIPPNTVAAGVQVQVNGHVVDGTRAASTYAPPYGGVTVDVQVWLAQHVDVAAR